MLIEAKVVDNVLGIDIAKASFDVVLLQKEGEYHHQFTNDAQGFSELAAWLKKHGVKELHACMEATNRYWEDIADYLWKAKYQVSVVNPMRIKGFAISQMQRNKTDKLDSKVIADYCKQVLPTLYLPASELERELKEQARYKKTLEKTIQQHKNRLQDARSETVKTSIKRTIKQLEDELKDLEKTIKQLLKDDDKLSEDNKLLLSIPGIGETTSLKILTELGDLSRYTSTSAVAADAGLCPALYKSGTSVQRRTRLSKLGKSSLRAALYFPAMTAMKYNPIIQEFVKRLKAKAKPFKVILVAVMRKLLHIAFGVIKHQTPFDPDFSSS